MPRLAHRHSLIFRLQLAGRRTHRAKTTPKLAHRGFFFRRNPSPSCRAEMTPRLAHRRFFLRNHFSSCRAETTPRLAHRGLFFRQNHSNSGPGWNTWRTIHDRVKMENSFTVLMRTEKKRVNTRNTTFRCQIRSPIRDCSHGDKQFYLLVHALMDIELLPLPQRAWRNVTGYDNQSVTGGDKVVIKGWELRK